MERLRQSVVKRLQICARMQEGHVGQLLWRCAQIQFVRKEARYDSKTRWNRVYVYVNSFPLFSYAKSIAEVDPRYYGTPCICNFLLLAVRQPPYDKKSSINSEFNSEYKLRAIMVKRKRKEGKIVPSFLTQPLWIN